MIPQTPLVAKGEIRWQNGRKGLTAEIAENAEKELNRKGAKDARKNRGKTFAFFASSRFNSLWSLW